MLFRRLLNDFVASDGNGGESAEEVAVGEAENPKLSFKAPGADLVGRRIKGDRKNGPLVPLQSGDSRTVICFV